LVGVAGIEPATSCSQITNWEFTMVRHIPPAVGGTGLPAILESVAVHVRTAWVAVRLPSGEINPFAEKAKLR